MKALTLPLIAASLALATPAFADESHHPAQPGATQAAPAQPDAKTMQKMQDNLTTMQKQLDRIGKAKTPAERQKLMAEYMQTLQANMGMMQGMLSGTGDCAMMPMMQGGMGMMGQGMMGAGDMMAKRMEAMEKRMEMMQMMMQMLMQSGGPAKPAN